MTRSGIAVCLNSLKRPPGHHHLRHFSCMSISCQWPLNRVVSFQILLKLYIWFAITASTYVTVATLITVEKVIEQNMHNREFEEEEQDIPLVV